MAIAVGPFDIWLTDKLTSLSPDFDTEVFVSYIISILDTDSPLEEKTESIQEILSQVLDDEGKCKEVCQELVDHWVMQSGNSTDSSQADKKADMGELLSEIMGQQTLATVKEKRLTDEEKAHKQAILAQYAQISDGEATDEEPEDPGGVPAVPVQKGKGEPADSLMERNLNAVLVAQAEKEQRDKSKQEHERKKEKDKQDRDAQRQKQQERKDAEKKRTQKGERRR